jgi:hypothetical protein
MGNVVFVSGDLDLEQRKFLQGSLAFSPVETMFGYRDCETDQTSAKLSDSLCQGLTRRFDETMTTSRRCRSAVYAVFSMMHQ